MVCCSAQEVKAITFTVADAAFLSTTNRLCKCSFREIIQNLEQCSFNVDDVVISVGSKSEGMSLSNFEFVQLIIKLNGQSSWR
jgi:hypothetical protein